mgnify:CR=1 FL=1
MKNFIKQTSILSIAITVAFVIWLGIQVVYGAATWSYPSCDPLAAGGPGACNTPAPVNVGIDTQVNQADWALTAF